MNLVVCASILGSARVPITPEEVNVWNFQLLGLWFGELWVVFCFTQGQTWQHGQHNEVHHLRGSSCSTEARAGASCPALVISTWGLVTIHLIKWWNMLRSQAHGLPQPPNSKISGICNFLGLWLAAVVRGYTGFLTHLLLDVFISFAPKRPVDRFPQPLKS